MDVRFISDPKGYDEEMLRYYGCMEEIKLRYITIKRAIQQTTQEQTKILSTEYVCLQFRSIMELIILSNFAANKKCYNESYEELKEFWRIQDIINGVGGKKPLLGLKHKNPNYFPHPLSKDTGNVIDDILTEDGLIKIYKECSDYLHPYNPFREPRDYKIREQFPTWLAKVKAQMEFHAIQMLDYKMKLFANLDLDNKVTGLQIGYLKPKTEQVR